VSGGALVPFMLLAALGFILSVAVHVASIAGIAIPGGQSVMLLHIGIFCRVDPHRPDQQENVRRGTSEIQLEDPASAFPRLGPSFGVRGRGLRGLELRPFHGNQREDTISAGRPARGRPWILGALDVFLRGCFSDALFGSQSTGIAAREDLQ
jgi:hypothetical protein